MKKKITSISDLTMEKYLESVDAQPLTLQYLSRREYGTKVEIDGNEYAFIAGSEEELDRLVEDKRNELRSEKRRIRIDDIVK
jgi:hypothetical protein